MNEIDKLITYAENRRDECCQQGEDITVIRYWVGYIDGLRAVKKERDAELTRLREQLDAAIADMPRKCLTCGKRKGWETCKEAKLISDGEECLNWIWRGEKEE